MSRVVNLGGAVFVFLALVPSSSGAVWHVGYNSEPRWRVAQVEPDGPPADDAIAGRRRPPVSPRPPPAPDPSVRPTPRATPGAAAPAHNAAPLSPASASRFAPGSRPLPAASPVAATASSATNEPVDFAERAKRGKFSFDFAKAEVLDVVRAISDMTRRNFIIPENLKGQRITILSPTKISAAEAYQVFLAALEVNSITIVRSGKFYKLMPAKDAIREPVPTCVGDDDEGCPRSSEQIITTILPLRYVDAQQLSPIIQSLKSKDGEMQVFQPTNAIIISEYGHNLTRIRRIIDALDVPGFEDELQIVPVQYATATDIASKITQIFDVSAAKGGGRSGAPARATKAVPRAEGAPPAPAGAETEGGDSDVQISKVVPDDRTNQIIIKANRRSFDAIRRVIAKLDIPVSESEQGRVHVYYLENASADTLASTLSSLAQNQPNRNAARTTRAPNPTDAASQGRATGPSETATLFEGEVKVTADKATNSLIVVSSGRDYRSLSRIIEQLDRPRRQVYVEAAILEVTVGNSLDYGLNYHLPGRFANGDLPGGEATAGSIGFMQSAGGSSTISAFASPAQFLGVAGGALAGVFGKAFSLNIGGTNVSVPSFGVILKLLETSSNARILSTPHLLTTDNEEASISVGQKVPFVRGTQLPSSATTTSTDSASASLLSSLGSLSNAFSSVDRIDVSLKLTMTPQINERGKIKLQIDQQVEDIVGEVQATSTPTTASRSAKTVVVVDDQQTVVIGGLMRDRVTDSETKIPVLGDLPILGWLFKSRAHKVEKVNLLLVLTPYIIRDANDFQTILERKMNEYEEFAAEYYGSIPEYRAHIDYSRKRGPLANIVRTLRQERQKAENGGGGNASETVVSPMPEPAIIEDPRGAPTRVDAVDSPAEENPMAPEVLPTTPVPQPSSEE